jgi:predicted transglutaminase-like cysteine proteinase
MAFRHRFTAFAFALALAPAANAVGFAPNTMQTGSVTSQPIGHYEFCQSHRAECSVQSSEAPAPKLTDYGWQTVREINYHVNATIVPMTDLEQYGRDEVWTYPDSGAGDCEDYVLLKRRLLIEKGFPVSDLLITVVRKPDGEGHAVLTVRTASGDYVLDSLDNAVKLWTDTPYHYLKRQSALNSGQWVTIENGKDVLVGSLRR